MLLNWLIRKQQPKPRDDGSSTSDANSEEADLGRSDQIETATADANNSSKNGDEPAQSEEQVEEYCSLLELRPPEGEQSMRQLNLLNAICFPIKYAPSHYKRVTRNGLAANSMNIGDECGKNLWTMMAYYRGKSSDITNSLLVGAITVSSRNSSCSTPICCCCSETSVVVQQKQMFAVQILTLAVLPTFRRRSVATRLLRSLLRQCGEWTNVERIFLHCQVSNEAALALYRAHAKLEPSNCIKSVAVALHTEERLRAVHDRCWALCWHHSGKLLASCGEDRTVKVWQCVALPEDNASSSGGDGAIDDGSGTNTKLKLLCALRGDQTRSIRSVAFSPCGRFLASASFDATVVVYEQQQNEDCDDGAGGGVLEFEELHRLEGHESEVKCVAFSASGEQLATCSRDKSVWVWQVDDNGDYEVASILQHHTADVKFVLWHPRDELLVSGGYDGSIRFYSFDGDDWITAQVLKDAHEETVWSAAFEPTTGDHLATVGTDRTIRIWRRSSSVSVGDQCTWQKVVEHPLLLTTRWPLYTIAWGGISAQNDALGGILAVGGGDCFVRLFSFDQDMDALVMLSALRMDSEVNCVSWRPTAKSARKHWQQLAVALDSGHIHLLQLQQNEKDGSGGGEKGRGNLP
uniref:Probable cytosolic iron-sulfur protein assembly protein CIAO1 homolog n=1 Tax=Globodera pallida TaxID=36090 RepID=A0A183C395_GLOPA